MMDGSSCSVPQELADMIIDHLHDDRQSLQQCSLVCKAWEPSSTVHLFSRLSWPPCSVYWIRTAEDAACDCPRHKPTFEDCHNLLLSSHRVRQAINHLRITGNRSPSGLRGPREHEPLPLTFLFALPEMLPGLQTLEVWDLRFGVGVIGPPPHVTTNPSSLKKLIFDEGATLCDDRAIFSVLSVFSHIDTVVVECNCEVGLEEDVALACQVQRRFSSTSVHHLEVLYPPSLSHVLCHLREQLDVFALREVKVQYYLGEGLEELVASAPSLEALTFMTSGTPPQLPNPAALRVLDMTCELTAGDPEVQPDAPPQFESFSWGDMIRNLVAFHAPELRELTLGVILCEVGYWAEDAGISQQAFAEALGRRLRDEDWGAFRATMKTRPKLQKLKMKLIVSDGWSSFQYMVPYLACTARTFQDAVVNCLGRSIESILEVVAEHHSDDIVNYYRYP
ncbi:hypothetical protein PsYK624_017220 [Phanerochaete sordida]|uniref:F-box domain-containing protein n=1 Tax=Phanerochaete sordida TaxID=48140 RepID=A0A9P3FZV1_9APHY|nr:hypothetical protein PsYK624_017220 [Phanerochaete sordida]